MSEHRTASIVRTTKETDIRCTLDLDGTGMVDVETGVPFFDHMLDAFGRHGLFDLTVRAQGDVDVDAHHTVEDTGIVLGQAFSTALGDKRGITRFGSQFVPMDEALVLAACDVSGRGQLDVYKRQVRSRRVCRARTDCAERPRGCGARSRPARSTRACAACSEHAAIPSLCALRMKCKYSAHLHVEPNKQGKRRIMGLIDDKQKETG